MPLPREDPFWSRVVRVVAVAGVALGTGTMVIGYITIGRFQTQLRHKGGSEFIEAALAVERQTMMVILLLLVGVVALDLYAATRSNNQA